jgi:hypothetical protein
LLTLGGLGFDLGFAIWPFGEIKNWVEFLQDGKAPRQPSCSGRWTIATPWRHGCTFGCGRSLLVSNRSYGFFGLSIVAWLMAIGIYTLQCGALGSVCHRLHATLLDSPAIASSERAQTRCADECAADNRAPERPAWFAEPVLILISRVPARRSRLKWISMPSARKKVCARRSRPASARGFFGHPAVAAPWPVVA